MHIVHYPLLIVIRFLSKCNEVFLSWCRDSFCFIFRINIRKHDLEAVLCGGNNGLFQNSFVCFHDFCKTCAIQERLKDLRVERGLTLEQLAEQTHLSKSALGSYEAEDFKDISHYALIKLAKFYGVTSDYLLGLSETKNHPNADLADLRLSDDMIELLKSGRVDNSILCELAAHPDFPRLMADLEIYVNGVAVKQVQTVNAIVDTMSATIMKQYNPGLTDPQLRQLVAAHIDDDSFCRYVIQQDINSIALDLREAHRDDFFSVPEDNPLKGLLQAADEAAREDSDPEQASLAFICKRLRLNYKKLSEEEKKWLKKISEKSDLLKNPNPQRGKRG